MQRIVNKETADVTNTLATANQVMAAVDRLNETIVLAETIGQAMDAAADVDNPPPWVYVYQAQVRAISEASEALETILRRGGYGGDDPHVDTVDNATGSQPRVTPSPAMGAACVP